MQTQKVIGRKGRGRRKSDRCRRWTPPRKLHYRSLHYGTDLSADETGEDPRKQHRAERRARGFKRSSAQDRTGDGIGGELTRISEPDVLAKPIRTRPL
jgi:hypothetical protein